MSNTGFGANETKEINYGDDPKSFSNDRKLRSSSDVGCVKSKVFGCAACSYSTDVASRLERHMRRHTGEKPYACKECKYRGTDAGLLKRHMRTHTGEKPFSCHLCDYRCAQACTLKEHMMVHTGKKPFVCQECDYQCSRACRLKIHMQKHTGVKLEDVQGSSKSNLGHPILNISV